MSNGTTTSPEQNEKEIRVISQSTEGGKSNIPATEASRDLKNELSYLKWLIVGVVVVVAIGFILNLFDIYNYRYKYFDEYQKKVTDLEKQNINLENKIKYEIVTRQDVENLLKQSDCFRDKKYWQYEECFK